MSAAQRVTAVEGLSPWRQAAVRLRRHPSAVAGAVVILLLVLMAVFAPQLCPHDPLKQDPTKSLSPPSREHLFGTDVLGRDVLSRVIYGTRVSLQLGVVSVGIAACIGVALGLVAGYFGGLPDLLVMRAIDILMAFPGILLALVIVTVLGPGLRNAMIAVGVSSIPVYARVVRGAVLSVRENLYVEAARAAGCPDGLIIRRHLMPNVLAPVIVLCTLGMAGAILWGSALSFLGLGVQPPTPEWGAILNDGRRYLRIAWWVTTFPGLAIMVAVLAINMLGDGLRDALDPRLKH